MGWPSHQTESDRIKSPPFYDGNILKMLQNAKIGRTSLWPDEIFAGSPPFHDGNILKMLQNAKIGPPASFKPSAYTSQAKNNTS